MTLQQCFAVLAIVGAIGFWSDLIARKRRLARDKRIQKQRLIDGRMKW